MKLPDGLTLHKVPPFYFVQVNGIIVWPDDPSKEASLAEANGALPTFPGGEVVPCTLVMK